MLKTIFKFLFYLVLITLVAGGLIGAFLLAGYPIEEAVIFCGILFGIALFFVLARKLFIRLRARAQVKRVLQEGDPEAIAALPAAGAFVGDLKKNWRLALRALKRSQLKLQGDPLYVLPWFMVFGRPGSGKSTALRSAKLLSPEIDFPDHLDGSTANLEWWLYEQAIVIDTAGRYAIPGDKNDREEWRTLLDMLAKSKQKEPLNGLVIAIAADRLLKNNEDSLMEEGRQVRASISDLMNHLEAKPPIYLMITKCDLIEGFSEWCDYLPEETKLQPMGYLNESEGGDYESIVDSALDAVLDRMKSLRLLMLERSNNPNDSVLSAPIAMEKLRSRLQLFIKTALKENVYQETPKFRGLYFSSSAAVVNSGVAVKQEKSDKVENLTEEKNGLFLHQFFTRVLPSDRGLIESLSTAIRARRALYTYTLSGMGILTLLVLLALSGLFTRDVARLSQIESAYQGIKLQASGINEKLQNLNRLRKLILDLEAAQKSWIFPWLGSFSRSEQLNRMIQLYQAHFKAEVLEKLDLSLMDQIIALEAADTSDFATGLVRRVNHLSQCLDQKSCDDFELLPAIENPYILLSNTQIKEEGADLFNVLYRAYLSWNSAPSLLEEEREHLRIRLLQVLEKNQSNFDWIIAWANDQGGLPVHIGDFWGGSVLVSDAAPVVPAAYTLIGRDFILNFWQELGIAYDEEQLTRINAIRAEFDDYYERRYLKSWLVFIKGFDQGQGKLRDAKEWLNAVEQMASEGNPYFELIERVSIALAPIALEEGFPSRPFFNFYNQMKDAPLPGDGMSAGASAKQAQHFLEKAGKAAQSLIKGVQKVNKVETKAKRLAGIENNRFEKIKLEDAAQTLQDYKKALSETAFYAESRTQSASTTSSLFKTKAQPGDEGPAASAEVAIEALKKLSRRSKDDDLFWHIYTGPLRVAYHYMKKETDCYLQDKWENNVLAEIEGVPDNERINRLIQDGEGLVWKYFNEEAQPYFQEKKPGKVYRPLFVNGQNIQWTKAYQDYINEAEEAKKLVGQKFTVAFGALPTGVNMRAKIAPYSVILELHCADKIYTLENFNYYVRAQFDWSMETCGEVTLQIEIGELTLRKQYKDQFGNGFSLFLQEFRDGRHVFVPEDFPEQAEQLAEKNVNAIDVSYEISGQEPIIKILETVPLILPNEVTTCWS